MINAASWFLVAFAGQYIGPIPQPDCAAAAAALAAQGVICRQASAMKACPVPDMPGFSTACPVFEFPQVTVKKP